jgi:hypothetical protein
VSAARDEAKRRYPGTPEATPIALRLAFIEGAEWQRKQAYNETPERVGLIAQALNNAVSDGPADRRDPAEMLARAVLAALRESEAPKRGEQA